MIQKILLLSLFASLLFARELYFTPDDGKIAESRITKEIRGAKSEIFISIYTFTNNSIAKELKAAAKRGVKIELIVDEKSIKSNFDHAKAPELAKIENITVKLAKGKKAARGNYYGIMHTKLAIIDNETLIYGSANWSNSAFNINNELIIIEKDREFARLIRSKMQNMVKEAKPY